MMTCGINHFCEMHVINIFLVEHGLVNAYKLMRCLSKEQSTSEAFKEYFVTSYDYAFDVCEYSIWLGILIQVSME